jgi:hypothetical protein
MEEALLILSPPLQSLEYGQNEKIGELKVYVLS